MYVQDRGESARHILHDRDRKYTAKFDASLKSGGINPVRSPGRAPSPNSYAEAWLGSLKRECLNHFLVFGECHLDYLIREYLAHYRHERPHQSLGAEPSCRSPRVLAERFDARRLGRTARSLLPGCGLCRRF